MFGRREMNKVEKKEVFHVNQLGALNREYDNEVYVAALLLPPGDTKEIVRFPDTLRISRGIVGHDRFYITVETLVF